MKARKRSDLEQGFLLWRDRRVEDVAEAGDVLAPLRPVRGFGPQLGEFRSVAYICRLIILMRLTWPSTAPELQGSQRDGESADVSGERVDPAGRLPVVGKSASCAGRRGRAGSCPCSRAAGSLPTASRRWCGPRSTGRLLRSLGLGELLDGPPGHAELPLDRAAAVPGFRQRVDVGVPGPGAVGETMAGRPWRARRILLRRKLRIGGGAGADDGRRGQARRGGTDDCLPGAPGRSAWR